MRFRPYQFKILYYLSNLKKTYGINKYYKFEIIYAARIFIQTVKKLGKPYAMHSFHSKALMYQKKKRTKMSFDQEKVNRKNSSYVSEMKTTKAILTTSQLFVFTVINNPNNSFSLRSALTFLSHLKKKLCKCLRRRREECKKYICLKFYLKRNSYIYI